MKYPDPGEGDGLHRVAFDFDGTLAEPTWPSPVLGRALPGALEMIAHYFRLGYECIVYTARPASHRHAIGQWLFKYNLHEVIYDIVTDKPRAALYIDDRCWNPTTDVESNEAPAPERGGDEAPELEPWEVTMLDG